jgi:hypothetical protein
LYFPLSSFSDPYLLSFFLFSVSFTYLISNCTFIFISIFPYLYFIFFLRFHSFFFHFHLNAKTMNTIKIENTPLQ